QTLEDWAEAVVRRMLLSSDATVQDVEEKMGGRSLVDVIAYLASQKARLLVVIDELDLLEGFPGFAQWLLTQLRGVTQAGALAGQFTGVQLCTIGVKGPSRLFLEMPGEGGPKELGGH